MNYRETMTSGGALLWFFQRITGVYLAAILLIHVINLHVLIGGEVTFAAIAERVATPMWKTLNISFLIIALFHGLYGMWVVFEDYIHKGWMRVLVYSVIAAIAVVFTIFGTLTMITFQHGG
ncbi:MAG: succinate dehydrogenase, hydrophobic membrane anchor protein [Candidatus Krumholzibacteriota bacterium]|nr:succinate dehydrogenase, hydrophobic membrane anchor protein [Candidatus Krumholzibacteriota bacterium]